MEGYTFVKENNITSKLVDCCLRCAFKYYGNEMQSC